MDNAYQQPTQQSVLPTPRKRYWFWILVIAILAILGGLVYYFGFYTATPSQVQSQAQTGTVSVTISSAGFTPAHVTIKKGATVAWTNTDGSPHTVTTDNNNGPMSPELQKGSIYNDTFTTTGTYAYHCSLHPDMKGSVTVVE